MFEIIDKLLLFFGCFLLYALKYNNKYMIVPILIVVSISCICTYKEKRRIKMIASCFLALLCIFYPPFLYFLPVMIYDLLFTEDFPYVAVYLLPVIIHFNTFDYASFSYIILLLTFCILLKNKTMNLAQLKQSYYLLRDSSKELQIQLKAQNKNILENQDYEINLATLNERNRISKEIHDNIGHLLSRSLLQIGALLTITKDDVTKDYLIDLKDSLSQGMDSIRSSIHNMYDESIDLYASIESLVKNFSFCTIHFQYEIETSPPLKMKYCFISIIKEALANIMKHSNATEVSLLLKEHPIMYQLIITDNGTLDQEAMSKFYNYNNNIFLSDGIGIKSIIERVQGFDGIINFKTESGLRIFITIPIRH